MSIVRFSFCVLILVPSLLHAKTWKKVMACDLDRDVARRIAHKEKLPLTGLFPLELRIFVDDEDLEAEAEGRVGWVGGNMMASYRPDSSSGSWVIIRGLPTFPEGGVVKVIQRRPIAMELRVEVEPGKRTGFKAMLSKLTREPLAYVCSRPE